MTWKDDPKGIKADHWLDLRGDAIDENRSDEHWAHAAVKWDGCIHYSMAGQTPYSDEYGLHGSTKRDEDDEYIHICSLSRFIKKLQELEKKAKEHFGEDWDT